MLSDALSLCAPASVFTGPAKFYRVCQSPLVGGRLLNGTGQIKRPRLQNEQKEGERPTHAANAAEQHVVGSNLANAAVLHVRLSLRIVVQSYAMRITYGLTFPH